MSSAHVAGGGGLISKTSTRTQQQLEEVKSSVGDRMYSQRKIRDETPSKRIIRRKRVSASETVSAHQHSERILLPRPFQRTCQINPAGVGISHTCASQMRKVVGKSHQVLGKLPFRRPITATRQRDLMLRLSSRVEASSPRPRPPGGDGEIACVKPGLRSRRRP